MIKAVIFDLDGTLIQLPLDYEKLFQEFSRIMKTGNVRPLAETISKLKEETRTKVFKVWDEAELAAATGIIVNDEGIAIYKKFSEKPKALVTMQGQALVKNILGALGLSFNSVITREWSLDRSEQLRIAAQCLKASLQNILFIGNTDEDFLAAKTVECQFLRVGR